ncbi:sulfate transporter family-domain-containing protein [Dichotomocladium elegans]|nr:sulfate transporter family-domain-containing protein [Dichotomocladium elegans]
MSIAYLDNPPPRYRDRFRSCVGDLDRAIGSYFGGMLPIMNWLPKYNRSMLWSDLICAITVGTVIVPQSMAYAKIAGLPPQYGLYSSFVGVAIYPFLGTSKDISIGTTAIISLLVGQLYAGIESSPEFQAGTWTQHQYVVTMSLFAGVITLAISILRLGILFDFICEPAIAGFMAGSGLTIVINQSSKIFGIPNINTNEPPYLVFGKTLGHLNQSRVDAAFGLLSLVWLYGIKYLSQYLTRRYPQHARKIFYFNITRSVVLIVFTTFLSWLINHFGHHTTSPFAILGNVPSGFQMMGIPEIDASLVRKIMTSIPSVVTLLIMEHCAIAVSLGKTSDYRIDVNQEILTIGLTNIFGSFFSAYPSTGSFSRSAVSNKSGAKTPLTNLFVAVIVVLALYAFTPAFQYIVTASLAAVIIHAVTDLIVGPSVWAKFWRLHPAELVIFAAAYIISLFTRIDISVYVPVALSLVVQLYRSARPKYAFLARLNDDNTLLFAENHPTLADHLKPIDQGLVCFQPRDNLVFENAAYLFGKLVDRVRQEISQEPLRTLHSIVLDLSGVHQMDYTATEELKAAAFAAERFADHPVRWYIVLGDSLDVRKCLLSAGFGTQRHRRHGLFHSDLQEPGSNTDRCCFTNKDTINEIVVIEREVESSSHSALSSAPDLSATPDQRSPLAVTPPTGDAFDWSTVAACQDVYPYFFYSLQDAIHAALLQKTIRCDVSHLKHHPPDDIPQEKDH